MLMMFDSYCFVYRLVLRLRPGLWVGGGLSRCVGVGDGDGGGLLLLVTVIKVLLLLLVTVVGVLVLVW